MYNNYKIVINTAAGRRRYMQYLIPYIVSSEIVDRYDIWINTHNCADIEFFRKVAEKYPVINLVWQPDGLVNGNASINAFYKSCTEANTIYFKLDDDIIWMEPETIEKMVRFRIENPDYFLVSPLVINNSLSTYLLQIEGKLRLESYCQASASHPILWKSGYFAAELHEWFLENYLSKRRWCDLHIGKKEMAMTRFSINSILWFGDEMKKFEGIVPGDDEEFLSCIYPTMRGMSNAWNGDTLIAHFAFFTQREQLDRQGILKRYGKACIEEWDKDPNMKSINDTIQSILRNVNENEAELMKQPSPYQHAAMTSPSFKNIVKKFIPTTVLEVYRQTREQKRHTGFIIK